MKKIFPVILAFLSFLLSVKIINAQGCSDAGVCSIHSIKNNTGSVGEKQSKKNNLGIGFAYGKGERSTNNFTNYLEYTRSISMRTSLTGRLGYSFINGELANTRGWTDLFLSVNHSFDVKKKWQKSFVVGIKLPLNGADIADNGIDLPMPYQTSLGTVDLVLGLNYSNNKFGATLALQQPLKSENQNKFLPGNYPTEPLTLNYWPTNKFVRKGDIVGRVSYQIKSNKRILIRPSLLGIYHLANDSYVDNDNNRRPNYNSTGLTLNGNIFLDFHINTTSVLEFAIGAPFIVRDQRPDGLTRKFVASLEYQFGF